MYVNFILPEAFPRKNFLNKSPNFDLKTGILFSFVRILINNTSKKTFVCTWLNDKTVCQLLNRASSASEEKFEEYVNYILPEAISWTEPNYFSSTCTHNFTFYFVLHCLFHRVPYPHHPLPIHTCISGVLTVRNMRNWLVPAIAVDLWTILCWLVCNVKLCICGSVYKFVSKVNLFIVLII